jgi:signal transduction histidine kinase/CheY-like chemotaxis protein
VKTSDAADLCVRLATADAHAVGPLVADALVRVWGCAAALVWLPREALAPSSDDLSVSGHVLETCPANELLGCLLEGQIDHWLADRHLDATRVSDLVPAQAGRIIAAWPDQDAVPVDAGGILALVAAQVSSVRDRSQLQQRLSAATTALREAEDEIAQARRVRALGEMASGIVHDFNNALTTILGFAELALGPLDEDDAFYSDLNSIRTAALDAAAVVRRLRDLTRQERPTNEREVADLREIAGMMPALVRPRWMELSECRGVTFEVVVDPQEVPPVHVIVAEIRELLLNLLFNAVDAMPSGGRITITTRRAEDGWAEIAVSDEGSGMSEETCRLVFQPFYTTKGKHGTGLGLSVCRTIAQRHGANLEVKSAQGVGTTFVLRLPPAPPGLVATGPRPASDRRVIPLAKQRVLFVDDEPDVRESVGQLLRALGHEVFVADSGSAAIAMACRQHIDVLITDFGMPDMNGLVVAQRFRVLAPHVPVVLLSGWGIDQTGRPANVRSVIGKPVTMKALSEAIAVCVAEPIQWWDEKCS